jgi:hypothetical protein
VALDEIEDALPGVLGLGRELLRLRSKKLCGAPS